jgi:hypothetical protein
VTKFCSKKNLKKIFVFTKNKFGKKLFLEKKLENIFLEKKIGEIFFSLFSRGGNYQGDNYKAILGKYCLIHLALSFDLWNQRINCPIPSSLRILVV